MGNCGSTPADDARKRKAQDREGIEMHATFTQQPKTGKTDQGKYPSSRHKTGRKPGTEFDVLGDPPHQHQEPSEAQRITQPALQWNRKRLGPQHLRWWDVSQGVQRRPGECQ